MLKACWVSEGYRDDAQRAAVFRRALGWLERYVQGDDEPDRDPVGIERTVAAKTGTLALSGRVDRIDERGDDLVIVDYKTGRGVTSDDARGSLALAIYAYATERVMRRRCRRVELHHLPSGSVVSHEHSPDSLARHLRRAEETANDAMAAAEELAAGRPADEAFPTAIGTLCGWCDFRGSCPGGAEIPAREPWAAVADAPAEG